MRFLPILLLFIGVFSFSLIHEVEVGEVELKSNSTAVTDLINWFSSKSTSIPLYVKDYTGMDRGLVSGKNVAEGEVIARVHLQNTINRANVMGTFPREYRDALSGISESEILAFYLILQRALEEDSKWNIYIRALPRYVNLPVMFSPEEIDLIEESFIKDYIRYLKHDRQNLYIANNKLFCNIAKQTLPSSKNILWACSYDAFNWGLNIVSSRAIKVNQNLYIVPLLDFRNFMAAGSAYDNKDKKMDDYHAIVGNMLVIKANRPFKEGRPITLDYEGYPSHYYFFKYGFVPRSNPRDCLLISLPPFQGPISHLMRVQKVLSLWGIQEQMPMCYDAVRHLNDHILVYLGLQDARDSVLDRCISTNGDMTSTPSPAGIKAGDSDSLMYEKETETGEWSLERKKQCICGRNEQEGGQQAWDDRAKALKEKLYQFLQNNFNKYTTSLPEDNYQIHETLFPSKPSLPSRFPFWSLIASFFKSSPPSLLPIQWRASRKLLYTLAIDHLGYGENLQQLVERRRATRRVNDTTMDYDQWVRIHSSGVKLTLSDTLWESYGVFALDNIRKGDTVATFSEDIVLSMDTLYNDREVGDDFIELKREGLQEQTLLGLYILYQLEIKEGSSFWYPSFSLFPALTSKDLPILLHPNEVIALKGSPIYDAILRYNATISHDYSTIQKALYKLKSLKKLRTIFTYEKFRWARITVDNRGYLHGGHWMLFPYLDWAESSIYQSLGDEPTISYNRQTREYSIRHNENVQKSKDFLVHYGLPNWFMYMYKGKTLPSLDRDCYRFDVAINPLDNDYIVKKELLFKYNLPLNTFYCIPERYEDYPSEFLATYSIINGIDPDNTKETLLLLLKDIHKRYHSYITPKVSDIRNAKRGLVNEKYTEMNRYLSIEKSLLFNIRKNLAKYLHITTIDF
ncbi:hypothetical protein WA158_004518 [Blastocystis sp. Blastoise]